MQLNEPGRQKSGIYLAIKIFNSLSSSTCQRQQAGIKHQSWQGLCRVLQFPRWQLFDAFAQYNLKSFIRAGSCKGWSVCFHRSVQGQLQWFSVRVCEPLGTGAEEGREGLQRPLRSKKLNNSEVTSFKRKMKTLMKDLYPQVPRMEPLLTGRTVTVTIILLS